MEFVAYIVVISLGLRFLSRGLQMAFHLLSSRGLAQFSNDYFKSYFLGLLNGCLNIFWEPQAAYLTSYVRSGTFSVPSAVIYFLGALACMPVVLLMLGLGPNVSFEILLILGALVFFFRRQLVIRDSGFVLLGLGLVILGVELCSEYVREIILINSNEISLFHYLGDKTIEMFSLQLGVGGLLGLFLPATGIPLALGYVLSNQGATSSIGAFSIVAGSILVQLIYFTFSQRKLSAKSTRVGQWLLLISFVSVFLVFASYSAARVYFGGLSYFVLIFMFCLYQLAGGCLYLLIERFLPGRSDSKKEIQKLEYHSDLMSVLPSFGIEQVKSEVKKLSALVQTMFDMTGSKLEGTLGTEDVRRVEKYSSIASRIQEEIELFVGKLIESELSHGEAMRMVYYSRLSSQLNSLAQSIFKLSEMSFSAEELSLILRYHHQCELVYEGLFPDLFDIESELSERVESDFSELETTLVAVPQMPRHEDSWRIYDIKAKLKEVEKARRALLA
jgi:Na+/phosphate symporter